MQLEHGKPSSGFGIHILDNTLIVPVKGELDDDSMQQLQAEILDKAQTTSVTGVIIDMSAVKVLDSFVFSILADTAKMVSLLGARPVFVGFQAGAASALIDLNVDPDNITTALTMGDGLELLRSLTPPWKVVTEPYNEKLDSQEPDSRELDGEAGNDEDSSSEPAKEDEVDHDRRS